jgi:CDGSH-type Zn-finger protein
MPTKIIVKSHGSIRVEGDDFELYDINGNKFDLAGRTKISLCRCGQSKDKPFCDSTHRECGWQSEIVARALLPPKPKT